MSEAVSPGPERRKLLLIGWDGAGWDEIHPLLDSGEMPNLNRMVESGVMGRMATLTPAISPILWTSVATGQTADRHGILDAVEPDPVTGGVRSITRASLQTPAVWDILANQGLRCHVVGWPVTHPAKDCGGACVSDGFVHSVPGSISPETLEQELTSLRFSPQEWTGEELRLFDQDADKRLAQLAVILAEAASVQAAATFLMEAEPWDLSAVWFGAIGRACRVFPSDTDAIYSEVVRGIYRFLDLLLGRLMQLAGPDAQVMLVSNRDSRNQSVRTTSDATLKSMEDLIGQNPRGIFCATGPGVARDEMMFGAGLLDLAPTVLGFFGFAPAPGMRGQPISEVYTRGTCAPSEPAMNGPASDASRQAAEDIADLEALGYTDTVASQRQLQVREARTRRLYNLALVLLSRQAGAEAIAPLKQIVRENSGRLDIQFQLAHAYFQSGNLDECRDLCEQMLARFTAGAADARTSRDRRRRPGWSCTAPGRGARYLRSCRCSGLRHRPRLPADRAMGRSGACIPIRRRRKA